MDVGKEQMLSDGKKLLLEKKFIQAEEIFTRLIAINANNSALYDNRSICNFGQNKWKEAFEDADNAIKLKSLNCQVWLIRGACLFHLKRHQDALNSLLNAIDLDIPNSEVYDLLGLVLKVLLRDLLQEYTKDTNYKPQSITITKLSELYKLKTKEEFLYKRAELTFALFNSRNMSPLMGYKIYSQLAYCFQQLRESIVLSISCIIQSSTLEIVNFDKESLRAKCAADCALFYFQINELSNAKRWIERALKCENADLEARADVLKTNGMILSGLQRYSEAIDSLKKSIEICRANGYKAQLTEALLNLSSCLRMIGQYKSALSNINEALREGGDSSEFDKAKAYSLMGICYGNLNQFEQALNSVQQSKSLDNSDSNIMFQLLQKGRIEMKMGLVANLSSKKEYYRKAIVSLEECIQYARKLDKRITKIRAQQKLYLLRALLDQGKEEDFLNMIEDAKSTGERELQAACLFQYADFMESKGDLENALQFSLESLKLFDSIWNSLETDEQRISWGNLYSEGIVSRMVQCLYIKQKKYEEALIIAEKYRARSLKTQTFIKAKRITGKNEVDEFQAKDLFSVVQKNKSSIVFFSEISIIDGEEQEFVLVAWVLPYNVANQNQLHFVELKITAKDNILTIKEKENFVGDDDGVFREGGTRSSQVRSFKLCPNFESDKGNNFLSNSTEFKKRVYEILWKPLEKYLPTTGQNKISLILDIDIHQIPFCVITNASGEPLISSNILSISPSITSLNFSSDVYKESKQVLGALIVANPGKDKKTALPYAEEESKVVQEILSQNFNTSILIGESATKENFQKKLKECSILHIAAHGVKTGFSEVTPGAIFLSDSELNVMEIQLEDLSHINLAFLNCCYTGGGRSFGEGLVGLSRGFIFAGKIIPKIYYMYLNQTLLKFLSANK